MRNIVHSIDFLLFEATTLQIGFSITPWSDPGLIMKRISPCSSHKWWKKNADARHGNAKSCGPVPAETNLTISWYITICS
ncbi:hypothetical protein LENED_000630 [Lentinula edodes]|uniref:Uncharacterized protein n=1 Tax=Lentinula edodes TaxID=5353 RepID=A0A1Q3DW50_LENED|nr:hypothetical protein LENED_000630 [Lentinula edodes]